MSAMPVHVPPAEPQKRLVLVPPEPATTVLGGPLPGGSVQRLSGRSMGTAWSVLLVVERAQTALALLPALQAQLDTIVARMSHWEADSELSRYNAAPAGTWQRASEVLLDVLACALDVAERSGGAYDPTIGPLADCWGFGPAPRRQRPPSAQEIDAARCRVGWQRLRLDPARRVLLQPGGLGLDFSSIAKGYAVDRLARVLEHHGIQHFLIEIGSELRGQGCKPDGSPWWVLPEPPPAATAQDGPVLALDGWAMATSGDYRSYFEDSGRRYGHMLDPRSGWPVDSGLVSVTVLDRACMRADAHATAIAVLGPDQGMRYAQALGVPAMLRLSPPGGGLREELSPVLATWLE